MGTVQDSAAGNAQPWFVKGDIDGFFGLAIDNLIQFILILGLCTGVLGFPVELVLGTVIPGAAVSILVGNLYYAWQARRVSAETGRTGVTALPYGINTVSLFAYVFLVMLPVKLAAQHGGASTESAARLAWQVGVAACFVSAVFESAGAFAGDWIRRHTPRAALLSTLAGIAISFISIDFAIRTFQSPLVAILPLGVILTTYFAHTRMPLGLPGGAWAVGLGTLAAWLLRGLGLETPVDPARIGEAAAHAGFHLPLPVIGDLLAGLTNPLMLEYLVPVMLPMGLFNVLGSLQNLESAEAAGDRFPTRPSMLVNGLGSGAAALFGSCFPTTIYIGHPGWKRLGATSGYSVLNGIFFTVLALSGLTFLVNAFIPMEAGMAIVLWIGIIITAQAFEATPQTHAPAVAVGLFPAIAAWGLLVLTQTLGAASFATGDSGLAGRVLENRGAFAAAGLNLDGLTAISQGFMLTCMVWSALSAELIDRRFRRAALWAFAGGGLAFFGFVHAGETGPSGGIYRIGFGTGWQWALAYFASGGFFLSMGRWAKGQQDDSGQEKPPA
ncbi:MAG: NCS2 family permease [Deltaproteobacteria bacterium]|nr:NCS2 family permease [Deltaproteobacteria bacterium]